MRSYTTYLVFIFVPYLFLIIVFHFQLQLYDMQQETDPSSRQRVQDLGWATKGHWDLNGGGVGRRGAQGARQPEGGVAGPGRGRVADTAVAAAKQGFRFRDLMLKERPEVVFLAQDNNGVVPPRQQKAAAAAAEMTNEPRAAGNAQGQHQRGRDDAAIAVIQAGSPVRPPPKLSGRGSDKEAGSMHQAGLDSKGKALDAHESWGAMMESAAGAVVGYIRRGGSDGGEESHRPASGNNSTRDRHDQRGVDSSRTAVRRRSSEQPASWPIHQDKINPASLPPASRRDDRSDNVMGSRRQQTYSLQSIAAVGAVPPTPPPPQDDNGVAGIPTMLDNTEQSAKKGAHINRVVSDTGAIPLHGENLRRAVNGSESWQNKNRPLHTYIDPTFPLPAHCSSQPRRDPDADADTDNSISHSTQFQPLGVNYIYTAYLDERSSGPAYVRIFTLLNKLQRPKFLCHFSLVDQNSPTNPQSKTAGSKLFNSVSDNVTQITVTPSRYEMCENHNREYGGWILSCEVPSKLKHNPCEVAVSLDSSSARWTRWPRVEASVVNVPVFTLGDQADVNPTGPSRNKLDFGVCIPPLFGHIPSTTLVEFIELTLLLGADRLMFYQHQVTREIHKVLRYYGDRGVVTVIPWDLPVTDKAIWYHGQLLAINDCLYRNMHRFNYIVFNDIDEFLVPHRHSNWSEMMDAVRRGSAAATAAVPSHLHCGYTLQSAFFDPLVNGNSHILYDIESDLRTKIFSKVRSKVMVNPERIFELGIHHISKPVAEVYKPFAIEPELGFVHHYRKCTSDFDPRMNCQVFARDESLSPHIPTLRHNVHKTLWTLKELEQQRRDRNMSFHSNSL